MKNSIDMRETALHARLSFNFLWATLSDHPQANCWYLRGDSIRRIIDIFRYLGF